MYMSQLGKDNILGDQWNWYASLLLLWSEWDQGMNGTLPATHLLALLDALQLQGCICQLAPQCVSLLLCSQGPLLKSCQLVKGLKHIDQETTGMHVSA